MKDVPVEHTEFQAAQVDRRDRFERVLLGQLLEGLKRPDSLGESSELVHVDERGEWGARGQRRVIIESGRLRRCEQTPARVDGRGRVGRSRVE